MKPLLQWIIHPQITRGSITPFEAKVLYSAANKTNVMVVSVNPLMFDQSLALTALVSSNNSFIRLEKSPQMIQVERTLGSLVCATYKPSFGLLDVVTSRTIRGLRLNPTRRIAF